MRSKKTSVLFRASVLVELAGHAAMGVALGLAFALFLTVADQHSISSLMNHTAAPETTMLEFVGVVVLTFALGTTLTGLVFIVTEED
jgi:hypothetical protein